MRLRLLMIAASFSLVMTLVLAGCGGAGRRVPASPAPITRFPSAAATATPRVTATAAVSTAPAAPCGGYDADPAALCVRWDDRFEDELSFRVEVIYEGGALAPERFTHEVPANTTEFVFPESEWPHLDNPEMFLRRHVLTIRVTAIRPSGESYVTESTIQVQ